jgi:hypothetical protein
VQAGRRVGARCCSGQGSGDVQGSSRGGRGAGRYLLLLPHEGSLVCSLVLQHGLGGCTTLTGGGAVVVSARAPETPPPPPQSQTGRGREGDVWGGRRVRRTKAMLTAMPVGALAGGVAMT